MDASQAIRPIGRIGGLSARHLLALLVTVAAPCGPLLLSLLQRLRPAQ